MSELPVHHEWSPITDLSDADLAAASNRLPSLISVWDERRHELSESQLEDFNERLHREWAIETGIIERIYTLDEGTTRLLIEQGIDASLIAHDDNGRSPELIAGIIRDHQEAVEWLFDVVRQERPLSTSFIKELHQLMTRKQEFAEGVDQFGRPTRIPLRHGDYKIQPNNPTRPDGSVHEYCPPEQVSAEMDRLIELHEEHAVLEVQADLAAAWLHHRFAQIHPFQDGNGRVARALASLVLIRAGWLPLVVNRKDRSRYMTALGSADTGDLSPLVNLLGDIQERSIVNALSIIREVERETVRVSQMLDVIGETFGRRDRIELGEMDYAKTIAANLQRKAEESFSDVSGGLQDRIESSVYDRQIFVDSGGDGTENPDRRHYHRHQIVETAKTLDYFANLREHHSWARIGFVTESGRSEILLSLHAVGQDFRGVIGASMCFYRKQQDDRGDRQHQIIELQPVSEGLFLINYKETAEEAERRFEPWLERALVLGLDQWRRGE